MFVLAGAAMYSYFLMFPVIVAVFPSLLSRFNPQTIQNAFYTVLEYQKFAQSDHKFSPILSITRNKLHIVSYEAAWIDKLSNKWRDQDLDRQPNT